MAERMTPQVAAEKAILHVEMPVHTAKLPERTFELPTALYGITAALFIGFMAVMAIGFANPEMVLPVAVIVLLIAAFFGVPAMWAAMKPESRKPAKSWVRFQAEGIQTAFGHVTARDAAIQVLILPVLIFLWGIAMVTIAALA